MNFFNETGELIGHHKQEVREWIDQHDYTGMIGAQAGEQPTVEVSREFAEEWARSLLPDADERTSADPNDDAHLFLMKYPFIEVHADQYTYDLVAGFRN